MRPYKVINRIEVLGLTKLINENISYSDPVDAYICGTSQNRLINLQNVKVDVHPEGLPMLGGYGLSEGNDVILQYWDESGEISEEYWVMYSDLMYISSHLLADRLIRIEE